MKSPDSRVREDLKTFRAWMHEQRYADSTEDDYIIYLQRALRAFAADDLTLADATPEQLTAWVRTLPPTPASRNQGRKVLLAYYRSINRTPNPALELDTLPRRRGIPKPLHETQHQQLLAGLAGAPFETRVMLATFLTTGCRFSELRLARWEQFELGEARWRIEGKGSRRAGPKERIVPLHSGTVTLLCTWRAATPGRWVFPSPCRPDEALSATAFRNRFRNLCEGLGLDGVHPHRLRHTVATVALDQGFDLRIVQELLGHESLATTQLYTRVRPERLRSLVEGLPTIDDGEPPDDLVA